MSDKANSLPPQVDELYRTRPDYRPMLDFYIYFQKNVETELDSIVLPHYRLDLLKNRLSRSIPGFDAGDLPIDVESARRFINRLSQADFPVMENLLELIGVFQDHPDELARVCRLLINGDQKALDAWSLERSLVADLTSVVITWALRPSLMRLREAVGDCLKETEWGGNTCPLCGSKPYMARLEKDGGRTLACRLCGWEWRFPRIQCAFCGTDDRNALAYLSAEDDSGYRIDVCRQCKHYIKTVDRREREDTLPMELEDVITQHLDLTARERGYSTP